MADAKSGRTLIDVISAFDRGMNAGLHPSILPKNQMAFSSNATVRGGFAATRPPFTKNLTITWDSPTTQETVENGRFQGMGYFRPDTGSQCLIASFSGRLYKFEISGSSVNVTAIPFTGEWNSEKTPQVWMWQADKWMIINDGASLPFFYDGVTLRRSYGPSRIVGTIEAETLEIPAPGEEAFLVDLVDPWTEPFNVPVIINGDYYMPIEDPDGDFNVQIRNISDNTGTTYQEGQEILINPNVIGVIAIPVAHSAVVVGTELSFSGHFFNISLELTSSAEGIAVGTVVSIESQPIDALGAPYNSIIGPWRVTGRTGNTLLLANASKGSVRPNYRYGWHFTAGTPVRIYGASAPNIVVGKLAADETLGIPIGGSSIILIDRFYTGVANQRVFINGNEYAVTSIPPSSATDQVYFQNISGPFGGAVTLGQGTIPNEDDKTIFSVPELPPGRMGAYVMSQVWMSLTDGLKFIVGDLSRGPSGTKAEDYRDAVLKTVELEFGGGAFSVPESGSYITSIIAVPKLDSSLGQGPVQVGTQKGVFSASAPFDFYSTAESIGTPILPQILIGFGPLGQKSTTLVNSDVFFRSTAGYASLIQARRDFKSWGNTTISNEVKGRILQLDNESLLPFGSSIVFDNRFIGTVSPRTSSVGVVHAGVIVINLDQVSSLQGKSESVYDGLWTGLNILQLEVGSFDNVHRAFAFGFNIDTAKTELYELLPTKKENRFDNEYIPIVWGFETGEIFGVNVKPHEDVIKLVDGEISIDNVLGRVYIKAWYRFDQGCWVPWHEFSVCANIDGEPQSFPALGLGHPVDIPCNNSTEIPANEGYSLQVRLQFKGSCRFLHGRFKAVTMPTPEFSEPICNVGCTPV